MNLIVFDLEWNIGYQPKTFLYHGTELTLRGEIIQIGAARINERGDVLDTFEATLKPHIFRKLQHHIAKVTGLSQGDLDAGLPIREGLQRFMDWAGEDAELIEWGLDDVPVLKQNLFLAARLVRSATSVFAELPAPGRGGADAGKRGEPSGDPQGGVLPQCFGRCVVHGQNLPQAALGRRAGNLPHRGGNAQGSAALRQ